MAVPTLMCGIAGIYSFGDHPVSVAEVDSMTRAVCHRGPDGSAVVTYGSRAAFGHARLAIIDLTTGDQPMSSADGRYSIVFNGEIYNYRALRDELLQLGHDFRTHSDTEVIVEAYRRWGTASLSRLHGMFALAIIDHERQSLFLARDRVGIKPLYVYRDRERLYFASEIKGILQHASVPRRLRYAALADFLVLSYPLSPKTFFEGIDELDPGTFMEVTRDRVSEKRYWQWERHEAKWDEPTAEAQITAALRASVAEHLESDVPIGAFLSGGIDSSLLVSMLAKDLGVKLDTFNVRFGEDAYDESPYARAVAEALGTRHHEIVLPSAAPDFDLATRVMAQFDQPFGDSSAIPTYVICRAIRNEVKVAIGGDGGDEMFGGYPRFRWADVASRMSFVPDPLLRAGDAVIRRIAPVERARASHRLFSAARASGGDRLIALSSYIDLADVRGVLTADAGRSLDGYRPTFVATRGDGEAFIGATIRHTLPGDYLRKVDVASGAHGLEVRVPFLGVQVLDVAAQLPTHLKYRGSQGKWLLRKILRNYLPPAVAEKPKFGFGIPVDSWLGAVGRQRLGDLLLDRRARVRALIDSQYIDGTVSAFVRQQWNRRHLSRFNLYQRVYMLWTIERWLEQWNPTL